MSHHLAIDHTTLGDHCARRYRRICWDEAEQLPEPLPFRNFVAQARLGVSQAEHEAFFREMLGDVDEPTAPFGLTGCARRRIGIEEARIEAG